MQQQEAHRRVVEQRGELEGLLQETATQVLGDMGLLVNKLSKPGYPNATAQFRCLIIINIIITVTII